MKIIPLLLSICAFQMLAERQVLAKEKSPAPITALREAKTATLELQLEFLSNYDGKVYSIPTTSFTDSFQCLLASANIASVKTNADITFVYHERVTYSEADYGLRGAPMAKPVRIATGAAVKGSLQIVSKGSVLATLPFHGSSGTTPTYSMGAGGGNRDPVDAALAQSGLHKKVLSIFAAARGPEMLRQVIDKHRMVASSGDVGGGMAMESRPRPRVLLRRQ